MDTNAHVDRFLLRSFKNWLYRLIEAIEDVRANGKHVFVVAVSRKMPRLFDWLKKQDDIDFGIIHGMDFSDRKRVAAYVDSLEITTEHSLPFLFRDEDPDSREVFIVDDIIIHGNTIRKVSRDVFSLTGRRPKVSAIFVKKNSGNFPYADTNLIDHIRRIDDTECRVANEFIANCIMKTSLPMDMAFPIIHLKQEFDEVREWLMAACEEHGIETSDVDHALDGFTCRSLSMRVTEGGLKGYNNDFVKLRLFDKHEEGCLLVVYAPNRIPYNSLFGDAPFNDTDYRTVWDEFQHRCMVVANRDSHLSDIFDSFWAERNIEMRCTLSMTLIENYLMSLSVFNRLSETHRFPADIRFEGEIRKDDLRKIAGDRNLTSAMHRAATRILESGETSPFAREDTPVEDCIAPFDLTEEYDAVKQRISYESREEPATMLRRIFNLQANPAALGVKTDDIEDPETMGFGESFASLVSALTQYNRMDAEEAMGIVHNFIDSGSDEGRISSFYAMANTPSGETFMRRFFRAGSNSIL